MKTALITGASSGIGADAARHLAKAGFQVTLVARNQQRLEAVAAEISTPTVVDACDVSSGDEVLKLADRVRSRTGVPDVVVNSAGAGQWKFIEDTLPEEASQMIEVPFLAAFYMTHAFMRDMVTRGSGVFVHVNSGASIFPWPSSVGYTSARWALRGLNEALNQDLVGTGVSSCNLVLGRVESPYFDNNPESEEAMPGVSKLVRNLSTDECGRLIAKLTRRPKREVVHPGLLYAFSLVNRVTPSLVRYLLRTTGKKRS